MDRREQLVAEAWSWAGTPTVKRGCVKGAGATCYTFPILTMQSQGIALDADFPVYGEDFWKHATDQVLLLRLMKFAREKSRGRALRGIMEARPGDVACARSDERSAIFNHCGIVTAWPRVLHCGAREVAEVDAYRDPWWLGREVVILDPFAFGEAALA